MSKSKILIADDDEAIRSLVKEYLEQKDFKVLTAVNGKEAVILEEQLRPDLVILDVEMPVMSGLEACKVIRGKRAGIHYVPILFLSGILVEGAVIMGLQIGADDYVRKPFEPLELLSRINNFIRIKKFMEQVESIENVVFSLVKSVEARDSYTAGHSRRVAEISANIGKELGLSAEEVEILNKSSLLHDVGKIGVPDLILNKQGKLLQDEFTRIKEHPVSGVDICGCLRLTEHALDIIRHHHEKLDGSGYPDGLKEDKISKYVRIVTVADIFDALTTDRPYRLSKSIPEAISILKEESFQGKLDMNIVNCMERIARGQAAMHWEKAGAQTSLPAVGA
jgi:putative two-component system response regulator